MHPAIISGLLAVTLHAAPQETVFDFEDGAKPPPRTEITAERYKSGSHALRWRPTAVAPTLELTFPPAPVERKGRNSSHFGMWFYNPAPVAGRLHVTLYDGKTELTTFWFNLDFSGWRPLGADLAALIPGKHPDRAVLTAPGAGIYDIDMLKPNFQSQSIRADNQQPWAGQPEMLKLPEAQTSYSTHDISRNRPWLPPLQEPVPQNAVNEMTKLKHHFTSVVPTGCEYELDYDTFATLEKEFAAFGVKEQNGIVTGPALEFSFKNASPFEGVFLEVPDAAEFKKNLVDLMRKSATAAHREQGENKKRAEAIFLLLTRHMLDQGFQEGNNNCGWIGPGYAWKHLPQTIVAMREPLARENLLEPAAKAVAWLCRGSEMVRPDSITTCDELYNYTPGLLPMILLLPDPAERYQRMRALKRYYDIVLQHDRPFGPDGTIHHHDGHHLAYGGYTPPPFMRDQVTPLAGTEFAIAPESVEKLHTYVRAVCFQAMRNHLTPNLSLRGGVRADLNATEISRAAVMLTGVVDEAMAALYLDTLQGKQTPEAETFQDMGIEPRHPRGHLTLNLAATAVHRRDDWMAAAVGMNKYFRGLEIYGWLENNNYGRYSRNGTVWLSLSGNDGWQAEGWNHNFWPGGTNIVCRPEELFEGYANFYSKRDFAGGIALNGNGVWGVDFEQRDVKFRKSAFFFGDRITVLTTDAAPVNAPGREVVTTILQQAVPPNGGFLTANGEIIESGAIRQFDGKSPVLLRDTLGNGYYIHPGTPFTAQRGEQEWSYFFKRYLINPEDNPAEDIRTMKFREKPLEANTRYYRPTRGLFDRVWFSHGKDPQEGRCAYTILVDSSPDEWSRFVAAMSNPETRPVEILQMDQHCHAVFDRKTQTTGYAVFDASAPLPGILRRISTPAFVMVCENKTDNTNTIALATVSPAAPPEVTVELADGTTRTVAANYPLGNTITVERRQK